MTLRNELEIIIEQLDSMKDAFETLRDNCYHIRKSLENLNKREKEGK